MEHTTEGIKKARHYNFERPAVWNKKGKALGMLALAASGYIAGLNQHAAFDFFSHLGNKNNETNDFSKFDLANNSVELGKVYKAEKINDGKVTFHQITSEELTPYDVAIDMGAKNAEKLVNDIIEPQLKDPQTKVVGDIQDRMIVIPNDMLNK